MFGKSYGSLASYKERKNIQFWEHQLLEQNDHVTGRSSSNSCRVITTVSIYKQIKIKRIIWRSYLCLPFTHRNIYNVFHHSVFRSHLLFGMQVAKHPLWESVKAAASRFVQEGTAQLLKNQGFRHLFSSYHYWMSIHFQSSYGASLKWCL